MPNDTADIHSEPGSTVRVTRALRLRELGRDGSVRAALFAFLLTRAIVLVVFILTAQIDRPAGGTFEESRNASIDLRKASIGQELRRIVMTGDINWYVGIAEKGYERRPFNAETYHNWAFFPLFPMLLTAGEAVTGEFALTGMALSAVCFFVGLILLHKCARQFGFDQSAADRAVFYLAAFPTSYFFSLPLTESLFLALTIGAFCAARREHWWMAGLLGACASATRVTGVLLLPALAVLYWQMHGRRLRLNLLSLLLVPAGLVGFMAYLYRLTGNPFAFKDVLSAWGRTTGLFVRPLLEYLRAPLHLAVPWDFKLLNFAAALLALLAGIILLRRRQWALGSYALLSTVIALSSLLLQSQARYAMVVFPIFFLLGQAGSRPWLDQAIRTIFVALLALMSALFAAHFNIALS